MKPRYCYWSVVNGDYALMAQAVVDSARRVGVFKDFHLWTDRPVKGAVCHEAGQFERWGCLFKLLYLRDAVRKPDYGYFIWMDMGRYFVRHPGDVLRVLRGAPLHIALECDLSRSDNQRTDWWDCPNARFVELMRAQGVRGRPVFNVNGGLFIVHREVVQDAAHPACDVFPSCQRQCFTINGEPVLAEVRRVLSNLRNSTRGRRPRTLGTRTEKARSRPGGSARRGQCPDAPVDKCYFRIRCDGAACLLQVRSTRSFHS